jgi:hypothetical protein
MASPRLYLRLEPSAPSSARLLRRGASSADADGNIIGDNTAGTEANPTPSPTPAAQQGTSPKQGSGGGGQRSTWAERMARLRSGTATEEDLRLINEFRSRALQSKSGSDANAKLSPGAGIKNADPSGSGDSTHTETGSMRSGRTTPTDGGGWVDDYGRSSTAGAAAGDNPLPPAIQRQLDAGEITFAQARHALETLNAADAARRQRQRDADRRRRERGKKPELSETGAEQAARRSNEPTPGVKSGSSSSGSKKRGESRYVKLKRVNEDGTATPAQRAAWAKAQERARSGNAKKKAAREEARGIKAAVKKETAQKEAAAAAEKAAEKQAEEQRRSRARQDRDNEIVQEEPTSQVSRKPARQPKKGGADSVQRGLGVAKQQLPPPTSAGDDSSPNKLFSSSDEAPSANRWRAPYGLASAVSQHSRRRDAGLMNTIANRGEQTAGYVRTLLFRGRKETASPNGHGDQAGGNRAWRDAVAYLRSGRMMEEVAATLSKPHMYMRPSPRFAGIARFP